ncbi:MAG TPA: biopolymer transporter ExbD [Chitinophagaceae bacterium]|nr:biopolymer transporter ExbD [Chitinophagaceae bacterium]
MAEVEERLSVKSGNHNKKKIQIDLTPMVDLGFLLITFFIFTSVISQLATARLMLPKDSDSITTPIGAGATLTVTLARNNSLTYFEGMDSLSPHYTTYNSLRRIIQNKQNAVAALLGNRDKTVLIIRPAPGCTYGNFMSVMDEVYINDIQHYYILNAK